AGHWGALLLGNLPDRSAADPLVITNHGGQVRIGGLGTGSYGILILGGSHWVLTGKYDPAAQTGDVAFQGHADGYRDSGGTYGIFIDDAFESTGDSGLSVGGGATDFEIAFLEITRVGFAGALLKTDDDGDAHMSNVLFHDNYIHDTGSEGLYFGSTQSPPQHKFPALKVYNNRILRTGTEIVQLGQVGRGSEIYNNVFMFGALDWKNPFQNFQDNGGQFGVREGEVAFRNNILIGGASTFFQFFPQPRDGDVHMAGDAVVFHDNYFSHSRNFGSYIHAQSDSITEYVFQDNWFREVNFQYDELDPGALNRNAVFVTFNSDSPITFTDNRWSGPQTLVLASGANVVETGSVQLPEIAPVRFMDSGFPADFDYHRLEVWTDVDRDGAPVSYVVGDYVLDNEMPGGGTLFRCIQAHTDKPPASHPQFWEVVPPLPDDLRLHPLSPFQGIGLLDTALEVFADGFESGDLQRWDTSFP
ncbi:MAG: right-handed parallel beta-helix repeat-containing protein, partial [Acidobacteriota bacterium]